MKKFAIIMLAALVLSFPLITQAALLRFSADQELLKHSAKAIVTLSLDSLGEKINALSGEIVILSGQARFSEIRDGDSIISAWIERPEINDNKIIFAGIIPGGFSGMYSADSKMPQPGLLMKIGIESDAPQEVVLGVRNLQAYSGEGDTAAISAEPEKFSILFSSSTSEAGLGLAEDASDPFFTHAAVTQLHNETKGWFAIFSAEDRESGIDYFEIQETYNSVPDASAWQKAASPHKLSDQHRRHAIFIKAVDRSGNEKIIKIEPVSLNPYEQWAWAMAFVLIVLIALVIVKRRRNI